MMDKLYFNILIPFIILALLKINCVTSTVYYSGTQNETYYNSTEHCKAMGGALLSYGELLIRAAEICGVTSAWSAPPWYNKLISCYSGTGAKEVEFQEENNHLAICTDFCNDDSYDRIGLWADQCKCFSKGTGLKLESCTSTTCPGNVADRCGQNSSGVVFEKMYQPMGLRCRYRQFKDRNDAGVTEHNALCEDRKPFVCKVGVSENIQCSFSSYGKAEELSSSTSTGTIVGILIAVLVVIALIGLLVFFLWRRYPETFSTGYSKE